MVSHLMTAQTQTQIILILMTGSLMDPMVHHTMNGVSVVMTMHKILLCCQGQKEMDCS